MGTGRSTLFVGSLAAAVVLLRCGPYPPEDNGLGDRCDAKKPCAVGLVCVATGTCEFPTVDAGAPLCVAGQRECDGLDVLICATDGRSWTVSTRCESACANGACVADACTVQGISGTCEEMTGCTTGFTRPGTCDGTKRDTCCLPSEPPTPRCPSTDTPRVNESFQTPPAGLGGCPDGMAKIGDAFCIDRWEASIVIPGDDGTVSWSPYVAPANPLAAAVSVPGAYPQGYIAQTTAAAACANAGKRLCSDAEWLRACRGPEDRAFPYGSTRVAGTCHDESTRTGHPAVACFASTDASVFTKLTDPGINQAPDALAPTGSYEGCATTEGVFDLVGNLHEWTSDPAGTFRGGFYFDTQFNGTGCAYKTTAHDVSYADYSTGFRCCADLP